MCTPVEKLVSEEEGIVSTLGELAEESVFGKGGENTLDWGEN